MTTFNEQFDELVRNSVRETTDKQPDRRRQEHTGCGRDFFQDNNPLGKKYTTTRIKSRKFLSNIAYVGINKENFYNENSSFDVYLLVRKNLNPFFLDRKLADKNKHEIIYMLWKECMPQNFYKHLRRKKLFVP